MREIILDYWGGPNAVSGFLGEGNRRVRARRLRMEARVMESRLECRGARGKDYGQPLEAGKGEETASPLRPPE